MRPYKIEWPNSYGDKVILWVDLDHILAIKEPLVHGLGRHEKSYEFYISFMFKDTNTVISVEIDSRMDIPEGTPFESLEKEYARSPWVYDYDKAKAQIYPVFNALHAAWVNEC